MTRLRRLLLTLSLPLAAVLLFFAVSWWSIDWRGDGADEYEGGIVLRDDAGEVIRVSLGEDGSDCRPYYRANPEDWIVKALVAVEDGHFWTHRGVRPLSIVRATCQNLFYRRRISGASTISMQVVRLIRRHPKTLWWKWKEAVMALKMERARDKLWILSQYLNRAPFGANFVGIESAAQGWLGKQTGELSVGEAALLAGMVQAPSRYRPDRRLERALARRDYVLDRMLAEGMITVGQHAAALAERPRLSRSPRPFKAPYFCDWTLARLRREGKITSGDCRTSLNADLQRITELTLDRAENGNALPGGYSMAAVIVGVKDAAVKAMTCSGDYFDTDHGQVNTAVTARPAGSTLKPFLMALAMDRGLVTPGQRLADVPSAYRGYRPANFDSQYRGLVTARDALVLSLNIPFVRLLQQLGLDSFGANLRELGFSHLSEPNAEFGLGMAIGNVEVSLVELATAYATLARLGVNAAGERIYSAESAYLVAEMLAGDERSGAALGHIADVPLPKFAWKTGTSSAYRDAWTIAWNGEYVIGVWCGHLQGGFGDLSLVGAKVAAPVAWDIARAIYPQNDGPWFSQPTGLVRRAVCSLTGLPANGICPKTETGIAIAGRSPAGVCEVHRLGADGRPVERNDPELAAFCGWSREAEMLKISKPENGAVFCLVPGMKQQMVVCQVIGNPATSRLWWFVDGIAAGETVGLAPFATEMTAGRHTIVCTTEHGICSSIGYTVNNPR